VESLLAGSREAAEALVETTYGLVYASLMKLCGGDAALAADLTQETYRKAWTSLHEFGRRARFSTWLYRIAYNSFLNHRRGAGRTTFLEDAPGMDPEDARPGPEQLLSDREIRERLRRAVLELPEQLRFTVTARFWGELPVHEIARLESVSEVAIRKRMRKALTVVRGSMNEVLNR
jgi:RNA polymerase sigma-70 factor (ECF subfamily)